MQKNFSLHDVLEPLKQALLASRDVIISGQIWGSKLQPPPAPFFGQKAFLRGGGGEHISTVPGAGFSYAPPLFYTPPPPLGGYFSGLGGDV